jgi:hypothetical protein
MTGEQLPRLDHRDADDVYAQLLATVPGYATYWRPRPGGAGDALLRIVARYSGLVLASAADAVDKGELAFLDALGVDLLPPQAAQAPMVFTVAPDAQADPGLPAGTQIAATTPTVLGSLGTGPVGGSAPAVAADPLVFATDEAITLARASLSTLYSVYPDIDGYADHTAALTSGFMLYDGMRPVEHHLYLGHESLLSLAGEVDVTLEFTLGSDLRPGTLTKSGLAKQPKPFPIEWEYLSSDGWAAFDSVEDHTYGLCESGEVRLRKRCGPPAAKGAVDGMPGYWLRGRLTTPLSGYGSKDQPRLPLIDTVRMHLATRSAGIAPDTAYANDVRLDTTRDFMPFGAQPAVSSTFVVACDQAFRQAGARIGISLAYTGGMPAGPTADLALFWEYSVAPGVWRALGAGDTEFRDLSADFSAAPQADPQITFRCPADWAQVTVNGEQHYWLRVRVTAGSYGGPPTYSVNGSGTSYAVTIGDEPKPPQLASLLVSCTTDVGPVVPDHCVTLNGFAYDHRSDPCRWGGRPFAPFRPSDDRFAAVYLGFAKPLPVGLVSLYVQVPGSGDGSESRSPYVWEYLSGDGWSELTVRDDTEGFGRSGMLQLIGPADAVSAPGPAGDTYFIRARTRQPIDPDPSPVDSVRLNAVWATQRSTVRGEVAGRGDGTPRQVLLTQHAPVLAGQRLEVQEWRGTGREWQSLFAGVPADQTRYDTDPRGTVTAVWVTWQERPYLYSSGPAERHYTIERTTGLIRFGNGDQGMALPPGAAVMLGYDYGGGVAGDVAAGAISQLLSGVPYLDQVANGAAAAGGAAGERIDQVRSRGPQRLRSGDRPVTPADYECLTREASPEVAIARCLPTTGPDGFGEPGWVTLVVVPQSATAQPEPSQVLLRTIRSALARRAPAAIAGQIGVIGPRYRTVGVVAEAIPADPGQAAAVESAIVEALNAFLHPVNGGPAGGGWNFGDAVHLSQVVGVVLGVPGVLSAPHVALLSGTDAYGDAVPVDADMLPCAGRHLIKLRLGVR